MKLEVEKVDEFPPLIRGAAARNTEERKQIQELLGQIGVNHRVKNVPSEREYNSLQQRIRGVARSLGVKVTIQWAKAENALYFRSEETSEDNSKQNTAKTSKK
jgi:predicted ABC-type transport system involved in lysophospholipase L1 biosynthesis ATPase subunit